MILSYFENLAAGIQTSIQEQPHNVSARKTFALELAKMGIRLFSPGSKIAWCGVLAPFDLLQAMRVNACFVEFVGAMLSSTGSVGSMLELSEEAGYSTDGCSYHRSVMGATLQGLMPEPDFLIATSCPCSGGLAVLDNLSRHFSKDLFVIHIPQKKGDEEVRYLAGQFKKMVEFVSDHTGETLVMDDLKEAIDYTNQARNLMEEAYRYACVIPSPARRKDLVNFGIAMSLLLGTRNAVQVARAYRDEFQRKAKEKIPGLHGEQMRLLWLQNRIQFQHPLEKILEEEHKVAIVADELNDITWGAIDPDRPYEGFAKRALSIPLAGSSNDRIQHIKEMAIRYQVDGVINPCHWGCRQGSGMRGLVERGCREIGLPVLNLEVDCVDPRNFSEGQLRTRVEAFVEILKGRKAVTRDR